MNFSLKALVTGITASAVVAGALLLSSCGSGAGGNAIKVAKISGFNPNHGPFDSRGNYVESWADAPPKRIYVSSSKVKTSEPVVASHTPPVIEQPIAPPVAYNPPRTIVYQPKPKPRTAVASRPKQKTKPKKKQTPIVVRPKSKPPIIHTVRRGDTLYGLARKYRSGVKTIQIANRLKGTNIRIGQRLKIPRF